MPSVEDMDGRKALISRSMMVTKVAITTTKLGIRTFSGMIFRRSEITRLENTSTKVAASPMPKPLEAALEIAKKLKKLGMSFDEITDATGLTMAEVNAL